MYCCQGNILNLGCILRQTKKKKKKFQTVGFLNLEHYELASVTRSDVHLTGDQEVPGSIPTGSGNILPVEIDHEIFSMVILYLLLIQEGQQVKECAQVLVIGFENKVCPRK